MLCCRTKGREDSGLYSKIWKAFIRPPRSNYKLDDMGPRKFLIDGKKVYRFDMELFNSRGQILKCSFFEIQEISEKRTCVIYVHTHSGSRLESLTCLIPVLLNGFNLFAIDLTGSGQSEGDFVSFGVFEKDDVATAVQYVKKTLGIKNIVLWGRSMGAVTILMYVADENHNCDCIVLDSPFSNLKKLCKEVALRRAIIPGCLTNVALGKVKKTIMEKAKFNIDDLDIEKFARKCNVPTIFITSKSDSFVKHQHSVNLFNCIPHCKKELMYVKGNHNDMRPKEFQNSVLERVKDFAQLGTTPSILSSSKPIHYQKISEIMSYTFGSVGKGNDVQIKNENPLNEKLPIENRASNYIVEEQRLVENSN